MQLLNYGINIQYLLHNRRTQTYTGELVLALIG